MSRFISSIHNIFREWIQTPVKVHLGVFISQLDPGQFVTQSSKVSAISNPQSKYHFVLPILIIIFTFLYGGLYLHLESVASPFDLAQLASSPFIFSHQMVPKAVWSQIDYVISIDSIMALCAYATLVLHDGIRDEYQMFSNGKVIRIGSFVFDLEESNALLLYCKRMKFALQVVIVGFYALLITSLMVHVLLINRVYTLNLMSMLFWLIIFPLFVLYIIYAIFGIIVYVILASKYIRIRQQIVRAKLSDLNCHTKQLVNLKNDSRKWTILWRRYIRLNHTIDHICKSTHEYGHYSTPLLSIIIPYYISVQCYLIYIVFIGDATVPSNQRQLFLVSLLLLNLFLFIITDQCAGVAGNYNRIEVECRNFYLTIWKMKFSFIKNGHLLKAQSLQVHKRFHVFAFRVAGNHRITSNTFDLIISYILVFFMFVYKSQHSTILH